MKKKRNVAVLYSSRPSIQQKKLTVLVLDEFDKTRRCRPLFIEAFDTTIYHWTNWRGRRCNHVAVLYSSRPSIQHGGSATHLHKAYNGGLPSSIHRGLRYNNNPKKEIKKEAPQALPSSIHRGLRYNLKVKHWAYSDAEGSCRPLFIEAFDTTVYRKFLINFSALYIKLHVSKIWEYFGKFWV